MRSLVLGLLCIAALAPPAQAQVYRWVDDRGVVNYASKPPANVANVARLESSDTRLSVVHGASRSGARVPPAPPRAVSAPPGDVDRATVEAAGRTLAERERCFAERRVDCANPTAATYDHTPAYSPNRFALVPLSVVRAP